MPGLFLTETNLYTQINFANKPILQVVRKVLSSQPRVKQPLYWHTAWQRLASFHFSQQTAAEAVFRCVLFQHPEQHLQSLPVTVFEGVSSSLYHHSATSPKACTTQQLQTLKVDPNSGLLQHTPLQLPEVQLSQPDVSHRDAARPIC